MTKPTNRSESLEALFSSMLHELMEVSDSELLDGENLEQLKLRRESLIGAAKKEAGRRRMASAKQQVSLRDSNFALNREQKVDAATARRYIAQVANDPRYTLAARNSVGLSDEEAIALYVKIKAMEKASGDKGRGSGS